MKNISHNTRNSVFNLQTIAASVLFAASVLASVPSAALELDGVKFEERAKVAGTTLQLNGAGIRHTAGGFVRVYGAALYTQNSVSRETDLRFAKGAKRIHLILLRDVNANDFGRAMMNGLRANLSVDEQVRHVDGIIRMGGIFGVVPSLKKGESMAIDLIPGTGVVALVNGKRVGEIIKDESFFDAMAQIWIGAKPVDASLKAALLGQKTANDEFSERLAKY